ncbi:MAG: hypothetical protein NVS3B10_03290 [Polyangiales bacterium]
MTASIRPYRASDRSALVALVTDVLRAFGFDAHVGGLEADLASIDARYRDGRDGRGGFWIADADGEVVGSVAIRPKEGAGAGAVCELKRLYVHPTARGQGLGQRLYDHAEAFARAAGYARIWLDSSRRFTAARRLYERNGFTLVEELDNDWEDNVYDKAL